jgi:hypothetical protein
MIIQKGSILGSAQYPWPVGLHQSGTAVGMEEAKLTQNSIVFRAVNLFWVEDIRRTIYNHNHNHTRGRRALARGVFNLLLLDVGV